MGKKCIRMGITVLKLSFGEVSRQIYDRKLHFMAPLVPNRKTKFLTINLMIYQMAILSRAIP